MNTERQTITTSEVISQEKLLMFSCEKTHAPESKHPVDEREKKWNESASWWKIQIIPRTFEVTFGRGSFYKTPQGLPIKPPLEEVIENILSTALAFRDGMITFEEWARELGYDEDSRKAESIFQECVKQAASFRDLLGRGNFAKILENWEPN